jgi:uncharacterized membrane protein
MVWDATARRRWLGAGLLAAALAMLIVGLTVLWGQLSNLAFLLYWMFCIVLTGAAMAVAFLDARALRERTRREERALLETTLKNIVADARARPRAGDSAKGRPQQ